MPSLKMRQGNFRSQRNKGWGKGGGRKESPQKERKKKEEKEESTSRRRELKLS